MGNMKADVICGRGSTSFEFDGTESDLWENVAKLMKWLQVPDQITVVVGDQKAVLDLTEEGIKPEVNEIRVRRSCYQRKWLTLVDPATNAYSFYKIVPHNMGKVTLTCGGSFGRIGASKGDLQEETVIKKPYPSWMYWFRYYEKINKGYQDVGDFMFKTDDSLYAAFKPAEESKEEQEETLITKLYKKLHDFAKHAVAEQINVDLLSENAPFTRGQVNTGWKLWKNLGNCRTVEEFNAQVMKLMAISPRKIDQYRGMTVKSYLAVQMPTQAEQEQEFARIIAREESLLRAMDAMVGTPQTKAGKPIGGQSKLFGDVTVSVAPDDEKNKVVSRLSKELQPLVRNVFKMDAAGQSERFTKYCEANGITDKKFFWHGSRNENWLSIITKSLMLNPNAVITGKMWGCGIYFAPSSMKSWNYTSFLGTTWAGGNSDSAFMGLFETAYGNPYCPTSIVHGTAKLLKENNANCLHAKKDVCGLRNDEVVFFDEDAICIRYLVEFGNKDATAGI